MALQEEIIPGNLHFRALNPRMSLEGTPFVIPTENRSWRRGERAQARRRELVRDERDERASWSSRRRPLGSPPSPQRQEASSTLLPISAKSPEALARAGAVVRRGARRGGRRAPLRHRLHRERAAHAPRAPARGHGANAGGDRGGAGGVRAERRGRRRRPGPRRDRRPPPGGVRLLGPGLAVGGDGAAAPGGGARLSRQAGAVQRDPAKVRVLDPARRAPGARRALAARGDQGRAAGPLRDPGGAGEAPEIVGRPSRTR